MSMEGQDQDRRAQGATRVPFEAKVEVGGALGPAFEADAVDVSKDGMQLRTAYLPEIGQTLSCCFRIDAREEVLVSGEVVWRQEGSRGGEFGIRFVEGLDPEAEMALSRILGRGSVAPGPRAPGSKVRLHIEGLGSPMRARIKSDSRSELMVGSELGFLQVGKQLELEDAETGEKRPARIDRVEVEIQPESQVPQLVVALRYDDEIPCEAEDPREPTPDPTVIDGEEESAPAMAKDTAEGDLDAAEMEQMKNAGDRFKGAVARSAAKITPALEEFLKRTKTTVALLAAKRAAAREGRASEIPLTRRTTAPPPGGGLHAAGRKVVRGDSMHDATKDIDPAVGAKKMNRRKIALGAAAGAALLLGAIAMRKPAAPPPAAASSVTDTTAANLPAPTDPMAATPAAPAAQPGMPGAMTPTTGALPAAGGPNGLTVTPPMPMQPGPQVTDATPLVNDGEESDTEAPAKKKHIAVTPFTNGAVSHGNVLRLKMDGAIEKIEGAPQPTGFTVEIPGRRSLEAAAPLAARDSRIASIKVENEGNGAELSLSFKDGVPNYIVRAKGDTLEIVLAPLGGVGVAPAAPNVAITPVKATGGLKHKKSHKH